LGFARKGQGSGGAPLWSWWNPQTARFLAQRQRLPELEHLSTASLAQALADEESAEAWLIETGSPGSFPSLSPALGWALPIGVPYGGATSGEGILFYDGVPTAWAASRAGFRVLEMRHRREMDRHPNVYFDADGSPTTIAEWTEVGPSGPYFPVQFYMKVVGPTDPFGWKSAPTTQADLVANLGLEPDYEDELLAYEPHDLQHLVRATHTAKALVWLANDQLAKDDLLAQAALAEMTYSALPNSPNSGVTSTSMLGDVEEVLADPGVGFSFGRGEGWAVDTLATGFALASPSWRAAHDAWFQQLVELVEFGQATCSGFLQAQESSKLLDGKYRTRQAYEQGIVEHALQGVWASALVDRKPTLAARLSDVLERSHYSLVHPLSWSTNPPGPHGQRAVGPLDESLPLYCSSLPADGAGGGIDAFQCWSSFAYAYARTGDPLFLTRAEEMLGGALLPKLESKALENIENRAALIALAKALAP
ncbi:MAG TPA: hypothetical protein VJP77_09135, partial [Planctomycetota bacterium]|nr:hypothetical protein [Planctomycetota bacterium]